MESRTITLSYEQVSRLADRLDAFGESLEPDERDALLAILTLASEQLAGASATDDASDDGAEVSGFQMRPNQFSVAVPPSLSFSLLGDPLRINVDVRPSPFTARTASQ